MDMFLLKALHVFFLNYAAVVFCSTSNELKAPESFKFFSEVLDLEKRAVAHLPGRFADHQGHTHDQAQAQGQEYDLPLLEACATLNLAFAGKSEPLLKTFVNRHKQVFMDKLRRSASTRSSELFEATLGHFHCRHAIKSVGFNYLGEDFVVELTSKYPRMMKDHLEIVSQLTGFSFLTVELVEQLYADRNQLMTPFSVPRLVESVSFEVLKKVLDMWEWELRTEDARAVLDIRGMDEGFKAVTMSEPRFWMILRKSNLAPVIFPMNLLLQKLQEQGISALSKYSNLILAFVFDSEITVQSLMSQLEFLYADLHKNDAIVEMHMTDEMVKALDSRKWDLWHQAGTVAIGAIENVMKMKRDLINQLEAFKDEFGGSGMTSDLQLIFDLLLLLKVPLHAFSRKTFLKSRDIDAVIAAGEKYGASAYYRDYSPTVRPSTLYNEDYWTYLWKQLEVLEIELVYDEELSKNDSTVLSESLSALCSDLSKEAPYRSVHWQVQLLIMLLESKRECLHESNKFTQLLFGLLSDRPHEISPSQVEYFCSLLHPWVSKLTLKMFGSPRGLMEKFRLAPESMTREETGYLIKLQKEVMKYYKVNVRKLQWLDSFTAQSLIEFFPLGSENHLENCEALYTVYPEALAGYLETAQGAINYPEQLVLWLHPRVWEEARVADALSELVPFSVFVKYPKETEQLNLVRLIPDIMSKVQRSPINEAHKVILKWTLHMEWFFFQIHTEALFDHDNNEELMKIANKLIANETKSRGQLISWLKANVSQVTAARELIELVQKSPLSKIRASVAYNGLIDAVVSAIKKTKPTAIYAALYKQLFTCFISKPFLQIEPSALEKETESAVDTCTDLIEMCLEKKERVLWSNRLKMINVPSFVISQMTPIPVNFIRALYYNHGAPICDLQIFFDFLRLSGYPNTLSAPGTSEFLQIEPEAVEIVQGHARGYETFARESKRFVEEHADELVAFEVVQEDLVVTEKAADTTVPVDVTVTADTAKNTTKKGSATAKKVTFSASATSAPATKKAAVANKKSVTVTVTRADVAATRADVDESTDTLDTRSDSKLQETTAEKDGTFSYKQALIKEGGTEVKKISILKRPAAVAAAVAAATEEKAENKREYILKRPVAASAKNDVKKVSILKKEKATDVKKDAEESKSVDEDDFTTVVYRKNRGADSKKSIAVIALGKSALMSPTEPSCDDENDIGNTDTVTADNDFDTDNVIDEAVDDVKETVVDNDDDDTEPTDNVNEVENVDDSDSKDIDNATVKTSAAKRKTASKNKKKKTGVKKVRNDRNNDNNTSTANTTATTDNATTTPKIVSVVHASVRGDRLNELKKAEKMHIQRFQEVDSFDGRLRLRLAKEHGTVSPLAYSMDALKYCFEYLELPQKLKETANYKNHYLNAVFASENIKTPEGISRLKNSLIHPICHDFLKYMGDTVNSSHVNWLTHNAPAALYENYELLTSLSDYSGIILNSSEVLSHMTCRNIDFLSIPAFLRTANKASVMGLLNSVFEPARHWSLLLENYDLSQMIGSRELLASPYAYPFMSGLVKNEGMPKNYIADATKIVGSIRLYGLTPSVLCSLLAYIQNSNDYMGFNMHSIIEAWIEVQKNNVSGDYAKINEEFNARVADAVDDLNVLVQHRELVSALIDDLEGGKIGASPAIVNGFGADGFKHLKILAETPFVPSLRAILRNSVSNPISIDIHPDDASNCIRLPRTTDNQALWIALGMESGVFGVYRDTEKKMNSNDLLMAWMKISPILTETFQRGMRFGLFMASISYPALDEAEAGSLERNVFVKRVALALKGVKFIDASPFATLRKDFQDSQEIQGLLDALDYTGKDPKDMFRGNLNTLEETCKRFHEIIFNHSELNALDVFTMIKRIEGQFGLLGSELSEEQIKKIRESVEIQKFLAKNGRALTRSQVAGLLKSETGREFLKSNQPMLSGLIDYGAFTMKDFEELLSGPGLENVRVNCAGIEPSIKLLSLFKGGTGSVDDPLRLVFSYGKAFWTDLKVFSSFLPWELFNPLILAFDPEMTADCRFEYQVTGFKAKLRDGVSMELAVVLLAKWLIVQDWYAFVYHVVVQKGLLGAKMTEQLIHGYKEYLKAEVQGRKDAIEWLQAMKSMRDKNDPIYSVLVGLKLAFDAAPLTPFRELINKSTSSSAAKLDGWYAASEYSQTSNDFVRQIINGRFKDHEKATWLARFDILCAFETDSGLIKREESGVLRQRFEDLGLFDGVIYKWGLELEGASVEGLFRGAPADELVDIDTKFILGIIPRSVVTTINATENETKDKKNKKNKNRKK